MSKKSFFVILILAFMIIFQTYLAGNIFEAQAKQEKKKVKAEVISLLGKKLYANPATGEELQKLENELQKVLKKVEMNPDDPENIILYGRRLAYLWRYHEAIDVYTKGIELHPDYAMLYRHRGHRYISIRQFDKAVADLTKASELNDHDFDIWYHLGLAHYLRGEFDQALIAYRSCVRVTEDDDSKIAISNWLYITLRRLGKKEGADEVLNGIHKEMEVVENQSYFDLLMFYKGRKSETDILPPAETSDLDMTTKGYGVGCWYLYSNQEEKAISYFKKIIEGKYWPAFGYIAAEAELDRITK